MDASAAPRAPARFASACGETPPARRLTAASLATVGHLLPPTAQTLIRRLGAEAALALLNKLPGAQLPVPKGADNNEHGARRWARIAEVVGDALMPTIAEHWGGDMLDVPLCLQALDEQRNRWLRERYDELTSARGPALSSYHALEELQLVMAEAGQPLTFRVVQQIVCEQPDRVGDQADLFSGAGA